MAKNVTIAGTAFSGVPSIDLPQTGGGTASFYDVSGTTAAASDVAQGKVFYAADGTETTGTASGGGGGGAIGITDTPDPAGGTIREITAVSLENDTVAPDNLLAGKTAHDHTGAAITGTYVPSGGGGGGDVAEMKQVNFIDYDGTIRHSYTGEEAAGLSALPENPSHDNLTAQGWNWTLAQIKTRLQANPDSIIWVGQMYTTKSGDTEIDILMAEDARLDPILNVAVNGTISVDWGDGTTPDTVTGTSVSTRIQTPHTYADPGAYTIKIHVVSGTFNFYGTSTISVFSKPGTVGNTSEHRVYASMVQAVRVGPNNGIGTYGLANCYQLQYITLPTTVTSLGSYSFYSCYSLTSVTLPTSLTTVAAYAFHYCYGMATVAMMGTASTLGTYMFSYNNALKSITIPAGMTTLPANMFQYCYGLSRITIPDNITSIGNSAFTGCYSLAAITIPSSVATIGSNAFNTAYGLKEIRLKSTTPPTVTSANAFSSMASDRKFIVPAAALETYQTANIWSTYASYIEGE